MYSVCVCVCLTGLVSEGVLGFLDGGQDVLRQVGPLAHDGEAVPHVHHLLLTQEEEEEEGREGIERRKGEEEVVM